MFSFKKYESLIIFYVLSILLLTIYYLTALNIVQTNNAIAEWLINYQGGFVRRGLLGELGYQVSLLFKLNLRFTFLIIQLIFYILYYVLIFKLLKNLKFNYLILISIFSPLFIIFPIAELEALGRKEVILFIVLILNINLLIKLRVNNFSLFSISLTFPILLLIFETSIFYSFFILSIIFISCKELNKKFLVKLFFFSIPSIIVVLAIFLNPHSIQDTENMCNALIKLGENCGMPTHFLSKKIDYHIHEVNWQLKHIIRYFVIFILGFSPLFILILNSRFNENKVNKNFYKFSLIWFILIPLVISFLMFLIAVDSGRWMHISYTCSIITYFVLLKNKTIELNNDSSLINFFEKKINTFLKIIIFLIISISWNPKAVYHEDLGSFPLYRSVEKTSNYFDNIFNINILLN
tara:strand:- start:194 stop:1417 length:1224 start_codon:yes stop_codon:yes gene_type:complete